MAISTETNVRNTKSKQSFKILRASFTLTRATWASGLAVTALIKVINLSLMAAHQTWFKNNYSLISNKSTAGNKSTASKNF